MNQTILKTDYAKLTVEIREEVSKYFKENNLKKTGNWQLYSKSIILLLIFAVCYGLLIFAGLNWPVNILLCIVLGFDLAAIGFNMMHDGSHGTYSGKKWVNNIMAFTINIMGGNDFIWNQKHNITHHSFTNIDEHDEDLDIKPFIRTNENQPRKWIHQYQHIYFIFLYAIAAVWSNYVLDFVKYFSGKIDKHQMSRMKWKDHLVFWTSKVVHVFIFIVIPAYFVDFANVITGYLIAFAVQGVILSVILHLAHQVEHNSFYETVTDVKKIDKSFLFHHLSTTANFCTESKMVYWFTGGLNFHIEHHLFPKISHIHYGSISKIMKGLFVKYHVEYNEYPTLWGAFKSHLMHLKRVGNA